MKLKKRFLVSLLAVALVIAALTISASALNSTMTYTTKSGNFTSAGMNFSWTFSTGASTTHATGAMTISPINRLNMIGSLTAGVKIGGTTYLNTDISSTVQNSLSLSVNNVYNGVVGEIIGAEGIYSISNLVHETIPVGTVTW